MPPRLPELTWIRRPDQRRVRWKNGAGWTTEIAARPPGDAFEWRLSVAEVEADCDFSPFPGLDRTILVLTGAGFSLHVGDLPPVDLAPGDPPHAFSGDLPARAIVRGPSRDFNVMTRRGRVAHTVDVRPLAGRLAVARPARATVAIYVVDGRARVHGDDLHPGDCLLLEPGPRDRSPLRLEGAAALVTVRLVPLAPASTGARGTTN